MSPNPKRASREKTGYLSARVRPEEIDYLMEQAERLDISLSESVRLAIARSYLVDQKNGLTKIETWIHPHDQTLLDVEEDDDEVGPQSASDGTPA
jgi:hypothetical protein